MLPAKPILMGKTAETFRQIHFNSAIESNLDSFVELREQQI